MKRYTLLVILFIAKIDAHLEQKENEDGAQSPSTVVVEYNPNLTFTPYNDNRHSITINTHDAEYACVSLFGKKLIACMECLSKEDLKKNFKKMSVRAAKYYLINSCIARYKEFLNYFSEDEWREYWQKLDPEDQQRMPATIKEQLEIIDQTYLKTAQLTSDFWQRRHGKPEIFGTEKWWNKAKSAGAVSDAHEQNLRQMHIQLKQEIYKIN